MGAMPNEVTPTMVCWSETNRGPVALVQGARLWLQRRFADQVESSRAVAHYSETLALLEGVHQTCIRQSPVGGHPHRLLENGYPYVVADVAEQTRHNFRTSCWRAVCFVLRDAESWVEVGGCRYNLGSSRLVGWVERHVGRQVLSYEEVCAVACGKEDFGRDEGARADGYTLPFELPERRHTMNATRLACNREGVRPPSGGRFWSPKYIREAIKDDVYRSHSYEEVAALVSQEVAARLDPKKRYGVWWFNRRRYVSKQVSVNSPEGRNYRRTTKVSDKPRSEWIAVPVPESGIPREWVDAAREAIKDNQRQSASGDRFWELSGGVLYCAECGCRMTVHPSLDSRNGRRYCYYRCPKRDATECRRCAPTANTIGQRKRRQPCGILSPSFSSTPSACGGGLTRGSSRSVLACAGTRTKKPPRGWRSYLKSSRTDEATCALPRRVT